MKKLIGLGILGLILIAGALYLFYKKNNELIVHPTKGPITEAVYGLGKVKSHHHYEAVSGVIAHVEKVFVDEGTSVSAGEPLLKLLGNVAFRTPVHGTVTLMKFKEGETALPGVPIARVEDLRDCYIELSLEQDSALRVRKDMRARVSFESIRNKVHPGRVTAIFPREDEFLAHVQVGELDPGVLPGMTADVVIEIGNSREAVLIPAKAVVNGEIEIRRGSRWVREKIQIGYVDGIHVEVLSPALFPTSEIRMKKEM